MRVIRVVCVDSTAWVAGIDRHVNIPYRILATRRFVQPDLSDWMEMYIEDDPHIQRKFVSFNLKNV